MKKEELDDILKRHLLWLKSEGGSRADLSGADLSGAYLSRADLSVADLSGANLSGADLSGAYLSRADLSGADLSGANLSGANLSRVYLSGANLSGVYLSGADLSGANLSGANLSGVYLSGATGNSKEIKTLQTEKYVINYTKDIIQIGCENHTIDEWMSFSDDVISGMDSGALYWWRIYKPIIKILIDLDE